MSYADQVFMQNIREILDHGVWDTDQNVRPHWEDGTPAHTVTPLVYDFILQHFLLFFKE